MNSKIITTKTRVCLLLIMILSTGSLSAQKVKLGIKFGINGTRISNSNSLASILNDSSFDLFKETNVKFGNGYQIGAFLRFYPKNKFFIQPELNYAITNAKSSYNADASTDQSNNTIISPEITQEVEFRNIEIPIMFGFRILNLSVVQLHIFTGPKISIVTDKVASWSQAGEKIEELSEDYNEQLKDAQYTWQIGTSLDVLSFVLDIRYEKGIANIIDGDFQQQNNLYVVSLGYKF